MKLRCDLNAVYAKRIRFSANTGDPHFRASVAFGATVFRIARISRNFFCASLGAALMYSVTVVGLAFRMNTSPAAARSRLRNAPARIAVKLRAACRRAQGTAHGYSACSVTVKIEAISIDIFHGELTQPPGLFLERLDDAGAQRAYVFVRAVDCRAKDPVNGRAEWTCSAAKA